MMTGKFWGSLRAETSVNDDKLSLLQVVAYRRTYRITGNKERKEFYLMTLLATKIIQCWWLINEIRVTALVEWY
jgi:hypothetical protein